LLRESKVGHSRRARVLFLSGVRRAESRRRANRPAIDRLRGTAAVFVNPLIEWTDLDMRRYRRRHRIPESDAAALMHRSGECNCGAFASAAQERATLKALYPDFFRGIEALEAEAAGLRWCRWGGYDRGGNRATDSGPRQAPGLLCESCDSRQAEPPLPPASTERRGRPALTLIPGGRDSAGRRHRRALVCDEPDDAPA
jgi:3'-phosphoadenosine 5'-phosphosulfate sulfotransferase (PAPS reductase)/FAD synthetase